MDQGMELYASAAIAFSTAAVQELISGLLKTVFMRKNSEKAELEKLRVGKISEVINDLISEGKMSYTELYKCKNLLKVAEQADKALLRDKTEAEPSEGAEQESQFMDFDWFMRFYDAIGNISNEDLQKLWGQVLAGEIKQPGTCSLRTLDIIRNLSVKEAHAFNDICRYVLTSGSSYYLFAFGFSDEKEGNDQCCAYMKSQGLTYSDTVIPLVEAGLLTLDHDLAYYFEPDSKLIFYNMLRLCVITSVSSDTVQYSASTPFLTTSGIELYRIICKDPHFVCDTEYFDLCIKQMRKTNPQLLFSAEDIYDEGE